MATSVSSNLPPDGGIVQPTQPSFFSTMDWNVRNCSIELIMTLVLVNSGMGPLENSMQGIVDDQNIQNKVDSDMIQLSQLISEIETASKANGANVPNLQAQLKSLLKNLFGPNAHIATGPDGQPYVVPDPNSDLGKFIKMLQEKNAKTPGYDYHTDPVFDLLNKVGTYLFDTKVSGNYQSGGSGSGWIGYTDGNNMWDTIMGNNGSSPADFNMMINAMGGNHWISQNPGQGAPAGGEDYLSTMYNQTSGAQSGLQGLGSQNTALLQTDSASENSLDQTGQNILNSMNSFKLNTLQHMTGG